LVAHESPPADFVNDVPFAAPPFLDPKGGAAHMPKAVAGSMGKFIEPEPRGRFLVDPWHDAARALARRLQA